MSTQANRDYSDGLPGTYVVNRLTKLAISGPHAEQWQAAAERDRINEKYERLPDQDVLVLAENFAVRDRSEEAT